MPFIPSPLERLLFLRASVGPAATFDLLGAVGIKALLIAHRLGVFDSLDSKAKTAEFLAADLHSNEARLEPLLELLVALRYLRRAGPRYRLTRGTAKWLTGGSKSGYIAFVDWWDGCVLPYWEEEAAEIIKDQATGRLYEWIGTRPNGWARAQAGFEVTARLILPAFVRAAPMPAGSARLLDAGGGHGLYSIALCQAHPGLKADILDVPEALGPARDNVVSSGLQSRIRLVPGDLTTDDLEDGYNVILMANVIHGFGPETNIDILRRARGALEPGGTVLILDQFGRIPGRLGKAFGRMLNLAYLAIGEGRIYTGSEVKRWLETAGFVDQKLNRLMRAPGSGIVTASRP